MGVFRFKYFDVIQERSALKVGTDAVLLGSLIEEIPEGHLLEIGSGTGVISLMLAQRTTQALIDAVEIDQQAAEETNLNFLNCSWSKRLKVHQADFFNWKGEKNYDLIFSNPPFYIGGLLPEDERTKVSKHAAFDFAAFFRKCFGMLNAKGSLWLILPYQHLDEIQIKAENEGFSVFRKILIEGKPDRLNRVIIAFQKEKSSCINSHFRVRNSDNTYSDQYKELTSEFHDRVL